MTSPVTEGYAPVNGVQMYWRSLGEGGTPLVVVHGGFGTVDMSGALLERLAEGRRVIAVELQGHGRTRDVDRPFSFEAFGDDLAALVDRLALGRADMLGYSLGPARPCAWPSSTPTACAGWWSFRRTAGATGGSPGCSRAWPRSAAPCSTR